MSHEEIKSACKGADMIVCGYAFTRNENSTIQVLQLHPPHHALILSPDCEILETSMNDVEIEIVLGYWKKNRKYMEEVYA